MSKIVYSYYCLDIIHSGHLLMMKNAKALAGKDGQLIVGVLTDEAVMEKKPKPILSFSERMRIAEAIKYIDIVVPQTTYSPLPNCESIRPHILAESDSHSKDSILEAKATLNKWGGKIVVFPYYPFQSSTGIKKRIKRKSKEKINEGYNTSSKYTT